MENPEFWSNLGTILSLSCQLVLVGGATTVAGVVFWTLFMERSREESSWTYEKDQQRLRR